MASKNDNEIMNGVSNAGAADIIQRLNASQRADTANASPQSAVPPSLAAPPSRPVPAAAGTDFPTRPVSSTQPNGRVGAMVDGVQTFSDATVPKDFIDRTAAATVQPDAASTIARPTPSGTFNGRTYSGAELDKLAASVNTVPSENFVRPGVGTLATAVSPDDGLRMAAMSIQRPVAQATSDDGIRRPAAAERPGSYDPTAAASRYRSDLADIINKDPRSVSGTAAWNAYTDSVFDRNVGRGRQGQANYQSAVGALIDNAGKNFDAQNQAGLANARDQTSWADNANRNAANITRSGLLGDSRLGASQTRADAMNYGADQRAGSTMYAADARGNAARDVATTRANAPKIDSASTAAAGRIYQQSLQDGKSPDQARAAVQSWLQARANTQRKQDDDAPAPRPPQAEIPATDWSPNPAATYAQDQVNQNIQRSRQQTAQLQAQPQQQLLQPTAEAIQYLQQKPHLYDQFDAKYGQGAAAQYLRRQ